MEPNEGVVYAGRNALEEGNNGLKFGAGANGGYSIYTHFGLAIIEVDTYTVPILDGCSNDGQRSGIVIEKAK